MATYHHGELPEAILKAARTLIEQRGLNALSVREAARYAKVSHNAPYRHFPNRDALLAALAIEGFRDLDRALEGSSGRLLAEAYVGFALRHPQLFRLMFGSHLVPDRQREVRIQAAKSFAHLENTFAALGSDAAFAAVAAWSLVHGLAQLILDGHVALAQDERFVQRVLATVRFATSASKR